ncbi:MAG: hypothetical protein HKM93_23080 [Desulfobacteraceae bacterium]|nr:hypothetical protein [Desulfobacteraceae bacterium]
MSNSPALSLLRWIVIAPKSSREAEIGINTDIMTIDMMEINESKLIDGAVVWTAEDFLKFAKECKVCLFT